MLSLKDQIGNTPLHYCVTGRRDDMLSVLVQHDVDLGVINQDGFNAIQLAAMQNSSSALKVILSEPVLANRYNLTNTLYLTTSTEHTLYYIRI